MRSGSRQRGVSLIEVLMAVLIFSVGLIGVAGLLVMAARSNHAAYLRTQVAFLAGNMADRMRANPQGVWNGAYNGTNFPTNANQSCNNSPCTAAQIATRDKYAWSRLLQTLLPGAGATISCTGVDAVGYNPSGQLGSRPPYGGNCEMTIRWSERGAGDGSHSDAATQTFAWAFQP